MDEFEGSSIDPNWLTNTKAAVLAGSSHDASDTISSGFGEDLNQDGNHQVESVDHTINMSSPEEKVGSFGSNQNEEPREDKAEKKKSQDSSSDLARGHSASDSDRTYEARRLGLEDGRKEDNQHQVQMYDNSSTETIHSQESLSNRFVRNNSATSSSSGSTQSSDGKSSKKKKKKRSCLKLNCKNSATSSSSPEPVVGTERSGAQNSSIQSQNIQDNTKADHGNKKVTYEDTNDKTSVNVNTDKSVGYDVDDYSTPSVLMEKTEARQTRNEMAGVGSFESFTSPSVFLVAQPDQTDTMLDHSTPSQLMQKKTDREVGELISGVGSFSSYTTPSKMMAKLFLGAPEETLTGSTASVLIKKRTDREENEKLAGVGSFQSFTSPSVMVALKQNSSTCTEEGADVDAGDTSMQSVFNASLTNFITSSDSLPPSDPANQQMMEDDLNMSPTNSSDEEEWVILDDSDNPLTKIPAMKHVQEVVESTTESMNTDVNDQREQPGMSFSVPEASLLKRQLEESLSAPEACIMRDFENIVSSEEFSIQSAQSCSLISELKESLKSLHAKYTSLQQNYKQLKVDAVNSKSQSSLQNSENDLILHQREEECRKLQGQLDSVSRKAKHKKEKMAEEFNRRLHELRNEMHAVLMEKEAVETQLEKARQDLTDIQRDKLSSLSQHDLNDESSTLKDELETTKEALEEMMVKLRDICERAEAEKKEQSWLLQQHADQASPLSLIPGVEDNALREQVQFLERKLKETWDEHASQLTTVEQKLLRDNSRHRAKHNEFKLKYEKQKGKTKAGYDKIKDMRQIVSSLQAFGRVGHSNHVTKTNGIVQQRFDSPKATDWLKIWTNPIKREKHLQQIFHEVQATDGGPDGSVKDHIFFQKVILFIWNQRSEIKQKMIGLQQKIEQIDDQQQISDKLEVEALQEGLNNAISENSMMETSFNQTIDQLVSENKELQVKIKHLEKTISALHHDNNLRRLEVDKIRSQDQSSVIDKKTDLSDSRVVTLKAEVECVRQHCSLLKAEMSNSKRRNENLMARLTQMEEEGQQYLEQLRTKQSQIDRLEIKVKTMEKQMDRSNDELDKGRTSLTSLVAKKQVADTRVKELEKKLLEVLQSNEQLLLENAQQPIVEEVITKTLMKSLEHQMPPVCDDTVKQLQDNVCECEEQIAELEIELKSAKEQIEVLQKQSKEQSQKQVLQQMDNKSWDNMLSEKHKLETELLETKERMLRDMNELTALRQEHEDVQSKFGMAVQKSEMDGLKKKLQLEEEKMMLRIDVDGKLRSASMKEKGLKQELDEQKRAVLEYEMKINRLQNDLRSKENEASGLNQELAILLNENVQIKKMLETITADNNNKLKEVGALTTQLQQMQGRNEKTRYELEHMLSLVSKDREATLGQDHPSQLGTTAKPRTDDTTKEELMIKLTEARIESVEIKHKLQTAEKNLHIEQTMNTSMREQHEKSSDEKSSMERALDSLHVEKMKWMNTETELNKQVDKLSKEREKYMQELLQAKQNVDQQRELFIEATRRQSDTAEKYEGQLTDIKKRWDEDKTDLEEQRDRLKEEKQLMKEKVAEKEGRIYALQETVKQHNKDKRINLDLRTKLASTKTSLNDMETTIEKLGLERDRYANETTQLQQSLKNAEEKKATMESLMDEKEKTMSGQNLSYSERVTSLTNRLQKTQNSLATVREGLQNARDVNTGLVKERSDLYAKLDSLRGAWEVDRTKLALTEERFTNMESKHVKTVAVLNKVQESNKMLNSSLADLDSKYSAEKTKVKVLLEHESELETSINSYDMRVKILDEQVSYYKKRLCKEEARLQQVREDVLKNNNDAMFEKQKTVDDMSSENKILGKENARLKQDLRTVRQYMEEQKVEFSQIQSSAYDSDVKQREMQWKVEQLTKELTMEKEMQDKLEKSCDEKDLELRSVKKQLSTREEKQKVAEPKQSNTDGHTSDQSILDLEHMMKDLSSEIKSAMKKSIPQENDSDDKKKNRELEMKLHVLHMQRLADRETISHLQGNLKDVISKLDRRDHDNSARNMADRTSPTATDICQALARAQVRAYAMSLNESPLYQIDSSQHSGLHAPEFSFTNPNMRTSTPHRSTQKDFVKKSF